MMLYLKSLFEYALWPAVFDCTVRYGTGTGQGNTTQSTALMTAKKEKGCYSRSYGEDVTSVTSCASQGPHSFNSRSYADDVTSVTSGASQGPHSFNLVFVCLFVCLCHAWRYPVSVPYRTVPSNTAGLHIQLACTYSWPQYSNRAFKRKIIT